MKQGTIKAIGPQAIDQKEKMLIFSATKQQRS